MIVRTPERRFDVLQVLSSDEREEMSVCRDLDGDPAKQYLLARFRDPQLSRSLLPMLVQQQENTAFEDYLGTFSREGEVYARFRYTVAPTLARRLEEGNLQLTERLEIGGNLLERMALLNMPPALQLEALRERNVTVDNALRVRFNYELGPMTAFRNVDVGMVAVRTADRLRELFAPELAVRASPELEDYLKELEQDCFRSYLAMYAGYDGLRKLLLERLGAGAVEPGTRLFRLWERIKSLARFVRPVLGGVLLIAAFCYLYYTLLLPVRPGGTPVLFEHIGAVEIRGSEPAQGS